MTKRVEQEKSSAAMRLQYLDSLRAVAIVMVVGVHAIGYSLPLPADQKEIIAFVVQAVSVPAFFFVDGFLLARGAHFLHDSSYYEMVKKGCMRLLLPWFIFTLIYTVFRYIFEVTGFLETKLVVGQSFLEVITSAYGSVYAPQMYFLFSLFLIRLASPLLKSFARNENVLFMFVMFIGYYIAFVYAMPVIAPYLAIEGGQEPVLHALWGLQFYIAGIVLYKILQGVRPQAILALVLPVFLVVLPFRYDFGHLSSFLTQYSYLIVLFCLFAAIGNRLPLLGAIGKNTMGIYLIHAPIVIKGVSLVLNSFIRIPLWSYLAVLSCTFLLTLGIVIVIKHIPYGVVLFGVPYQREKMVVAGAGLGSSGK